ncbi:MAG: bifunctional DNA-formamidopyrimidine glycosylase/DNA-(apurinic or apyrimidinic site) lyase [Kofleriaceae bacterium]|nr:bifunctional DNA-formamidopyrimidine glycosylase/DNA-(apurinic or apyrimidinic site) lyase [Kofleriaceae bacterium]
MPELPEVETVRRTLSPILGAKAEKVWWSGKNLRLNKPFDLAAIKEASEGATLESVDRIGKYLILYWKGRKQAVLVHLGMSGRLRYFEGESERPKHTHVEWSLKDGRILRFSDPRRFGQVETLQRGQEREHASLTKLGPDPLTDGIDPSYFYQGCKRRGRSIKLALLDQSLVAGLGNIYVSEALWMAKIHPTRIAKTLSKTRCENLRKASLEVLDRALEHGGTSLKDFVSAEGHAGEHSHYLWVYDREGKPCPNSECPGVIRRIVQQARATFYCPRCQR